MIFEGRLNFSDHWIKRYPEVGFEIGKLVHYVKVYVADEFFADKSELILMLTTGQTLVIKQ